MIGEHGPQADERKEVERIPLTDSRLLDALAGQYQDKQRRRAISYTSRIRKGWAVCRTRMKEPRFVRSIPVDDLYMDQDTEEIHKCSLRDQTPTLL